MLSHQHRIVNCCRSHLIDVTWRVSHNEYYIVSNFYPHMYGRILRSCIVDSTLVYVTLLRGCDIVLQAHFHLSDITLTILTSYSSMCYLYIYWYCNCSIHAIIDTVSELLLNFHIFWKFSFCFGSHSLGIDISFGTIDFRSYIYLTLNNLSFLTSSFIHS